MNKHDGFKRGSGCFICADCGKRTRATKRDGADSRLCADCFEFAGRENEHSDNGHEGGPKVEGCPVCCGVKSGKEYADWDGETDMTPKEPMKVVRNLLSGKEVLIPKDTPLCCDPSSETCWCM
jgi:hypothetical protein